MSLITNIMGWIETNGFRKEKEHNDRILKELKYSDDDFFIEMFCSPKNTGDKNPGYILFGASVNHFEINSWLEKFEEFMKKLIAFGAFVFIEHHDGDQVYAIGYVLHEGEFSKDVVELGDSSEYDWNFNDTKFPLLFPLLFRVLKDLQGTSSRHREMQIMNIHLQNKHPDEKYSDEIATKFQDKVDNKIYLKCNICNENIARRNTDQPFTWYSA